MSGIDRQRVVGKSEEELDELTCGICQEIFNDPVVTSCCRQTFCSQCINKWLKDNNNCPNDRKPLKAWDLRPAPRLVTNLVNLLNLKCIHHSYGCEVVLTSDQIKSHIKICDKNVKNLCKFCKTKKLEINYLKEEIKKLREENRVLTTALNLHNIVSAKEVIELTRIRIDDFNCLKCLGIPDSLYPLIIEKCKQAINQYIECEDISDEIRDYLNYNCQHSRHCSWSVILMIPDIPSYGYPNCRDKYLKLCKLKLRFHKIIIRIIGLDRELDSKLDSDT